MSFKVAYRYLKTYTLADKFRRNKLNNSLESEIKKIETDLEKIPFSVFIDIFQKILQKEIPLAMQVISINRVRNCIVHRHGTVGEIDVRNSSNNCLNLEWADIRYCVKMNDKEIALTHELRKNKVLVSQLSLQELKQKKSFKLGEDIKININELNGIAFTCVLFVQELYGLMPFQKN